MPFGRTQRHRLFQSGTLYTPNIRWRRAVPRAHYAGYKDTAFAAKGSPAKVSDSRRTAPLLLGQAVEHFARGKTVRNLADRGLKAADGDASLRAQEPVGLANIKAMLCQKLLQLVALVRRQDALVARPVLHEGRPAAHAVGEIADRQRIGFGRIVFHDDVEILQHQKSRSARAR